ncbi:MAG: YraN family protein [Clostridia bacterium]|nr:YraN family protein [Clostridia bacterium]
MKLRGVWAELKAVRWLNGHGLRVLKTRYRARGGEIDVIARENGALVFIEVKSASRAGEGALRVNAQKRRRLKTAANAYLNETGETSCRFDILEESDAGFRLIRNAF